MTERELFLAIGEVDEAMVAAAAAPRRNNAMYGRLIAAAAAVVIGVLGYLGLMQVWRDAPPAIDPTPPTGIGATTTAPTTTASTVPTAPGGLPLLADDGRLQATAEGAGIMPIVFARSIEELQIENVTEAPSALSVYTVAFENFDEPAELETLIRRTAALAGDTLTTPITAFGYGAEAESAIFRYRVSPPFDTLGTRNEVGLWLQQPILFDGDILQGVLAHCPSLFAHMQQPTLRAVNGRREQVWPEGAPAPVVEDTVTFNYYVYDAAESDEAARWLNSVSLFVQDGALQAYHVYIQENYESLGRYPVMSVEEATALLHQRYDAYAGEWYNEDFEIVSTELQYIPASMSRLRVPFYRFLVTADRTAYAERYCSGKDITMFYEIHICAIPAACWRSNPDEALTTQR